jgi:phosphoglycolate phosphatase-like HAD superfamily hydrolase
MRVHVAIVSDTPQDALRRVVRARPWAEQVGQVLGRPGSKPDHLRRILARLDIVPDVLVMVGDRESDRAAAEAVGARFVGIRARADADPADRASFDDPDRGFPVLDDLTDLVSVVAELVEP